MNGPLYECLLHTYSKQLENVLPFQADRHGQLDFEHVKSSKDRSGRAGPVRNFIGLQTLWTYFSGQEIFMSILILSLSAGCKVSVKIMKWREAGRGQLAVTG